MKSLTFDGIEFRQFSHLYATSACGKVLRLKDLTYHAGCLRKDGYLSVGHQTLMHRMIAKCWCHQPDGAKHVHHINHDKTDNRASNLEWLTPKEHFGEKHDGSGGRYIRTEKTRQKLRAYRLGRKMSDETRAKIGAAHRGRTRDPAPWIGKKHSDATLLKMSANSGKVKACEIFGVRYRSFTEAGKALGERPLTLRKRCHSSNFPDYRLLE